MYAHGCESAFDEIFFRHHKSLLTFLIQMVRDKEKARELLQDTFVRVARSAAAYEPKAKFSTWLFRIATNLCLTFLKRESGRFKLLQFPVGYIDETQKTPFDEVRDNEIQASFVKAVSELKIDLRVAFVLHEVHQFTYVKAASILKVPEGTVKIRVHRARKELQRRLVKELDFFEIESAVSSKLDRKKPPVVNEVTEEK